MVVKLYHLADVPVSEAWDLLRELDAWGLSPSGAMDGGCGIFGGELSEQEQKEAIAAIEEHLQANDELANVLLRVE